MNDLPSWKVRRILAPSRRGECLERLGGFEAPPHFTTPCGSDNMISDIKLILEKVVRPARGRGMGGG